MKVTSSYLHGQLDQIEEINFSTEKEITILAHCIFAELNQIGLSMNQIQRLTGAVVDYYQRADQYQFSEDQILYSGTEQDWYSVWTSIGKGITKAAQATTRATAGTRKALSAGYNKARANFKTSGWKSTFKGVGTRMNQGFNLGSKTKLAQQTQALAAKNSQNAIGKMGSISKQVSDIRQAGTMTQGKLKTAMGTQRNLAGITQSQDRVAGLKGAGSRSQIIQSRQNVTKTADALSKNGGMTQHVNRTQANLAKPTPTPTQSAPKPQAAPNPQGNSYTGPKATKTNPFTQGDRGFNYKGVREAKGNKSQLGEFGARFRNSQGNIMGVDTKAGFKQNLSNMGNWAASNKVQAGVAAAGTAAAAYGAYRLLRGPRRQPVQQQQPVTVNVNHQ